MRRILGGSVAAGFGLGMVFESVVFHQLLQWHHMVSGVLRMDTVEAIGVNLVADTSFDIASWLVLTVAVVLLMTACPGSGDAWSWWNYSGWILSGWAASIIFDSVVNHLLLRIHHVREDVLNVLAYDLGYLVLLGILPLLLGLLLSAGGPSAPHAIRLASQEVG